MLAITSFVKHWEDSIETLSKLKGCIEHLLLTIGLISRDIYGYQFSNQDPDEVDDTPSYCNNDNLNITYHEKLMQLIKSVCDHTRRQEISR